MVKAAPVLWDKQVVENSDTVKAIAINSGIANACTGKLGEEANEKFANIVGNALNVEKEKIIKGISEFKLTAKRMDIEIIKNNIKVINDSYNASYDSMKAALEVVNNTLAQRKIAILGDMLELGEYAKELHEKVGEEVVKNKIDILITIGENAKNIANKAKELKMENVKSFNNIDEAIKNIKEIIKSGDLILLKASNSMNFSKILNEIKA